MSYHEYYDYYEKCQATAPYHLFTFDIVNSKNLANEGDINYIFNISLLIYTLYKKIEEIEKKQNKQILHRSPYISHPTLEKYKENLFYLKEPILPHEKKLLQRTELCEPFQICGDLVGLTILRDTLTENEIYTLFDQTKEELNIPYDFHYANGYYETDDYGEGATKLYRGYLIPMLGNQHKKDSPIKKIKEQ